MHKHSSGPKARLIPGLIILSLIASLLALAGCAYSAATPEAALPPAPAAVEAPRERVMVEATMVPAAPESAGAELAQVSEQMIIRTADLALRVEDTETAVNQIRDVANSLGGYLVSTNLYRADDQLRGTVSLRIPAESFDVAMDRLRTLAIKVERENISSQDVTEEYSDLGARLRNLEATETELLALLTEVRERTRNAEDVLAVHRELTNIRGEIEQIKGRMQYLERLTALATINLELIPKAEQPIVEEGWQPLSTLRSALRGLVNVGQFLVDAAIYLVVLVLPVLAVIIAPVVVLVLLVRRWRRARRAAKGAA
jgi:hypothetical protein